MTAQAEIFTARRLSRLWLPSLVCGLHDWLSAPIDRQLVAGIVSFPSLSYARVPRQHSINNSKRFPINSPPSGVSAGFLQNGERPKTCSPWKREAGLWVQFLAAQSSLQLLFLNQPRSPEGPRCLGNQRGSVNFSLLPKEISISQTHRAGGA